MYSPDRPTYRTFYLLSSPLVLAIRVISLLQAAAEVRTYSAFIIYIYIVLMYIFPASLHPKHPASRLAFDDRHRRDFITTGGG